MGRYPRKSKDTVRLHTKTKIRGGQKAIGTNGLHRRQRSSYITALQRKKERKKERKEIKKEYKNIQQFKNIQKLKVNIRLCLVMKSSGEYGWSLSFLFFTAKYSV